MLLRRRRLWWLLHTLMVRVVVAEGSVGKNTVTGKAGAVRGLDHAGVGPTAKE